MIKTTMSTKMKFPLIRIRDNHTGHEHIFGEDGHDFLSVSSDGKCLYYENWHNGEDSRYGTYSFVGDGIVSDIYEYVQCVSIEELQEKAREVETQRKKWLQDLEKEFESIHVNKTKAIPIEFLKKWFGDNYSAFNDLMQEWEKEEQE